MRTKTIQTNFSGGEFSPRALGRVDIARYPNAAKTLKNVISVTLGGAKKRYGTEFLKATKNSAKQSRLIPYIIGQDAAYMLEVGEYYFRVFKADGTQVAGPYEVVTPYTEAQVQEIDYSQGEDAMYIFHSDVFPNYVRSFADANWQCTNAPFSAMPFDEIGTYPAANLTLSSNTVGTGRTMTADAAVFLASDVGRTITQNGGIAVITAYTSTTVVTVEVKTVFDSASIATGLWNLDSSPQTTCTPSAVGPVVGSIITLTLSAAGWRSEDVGKYVSINAGLAIITAYSSTTVVSARIITVLASATGAPALAWQLMGTVWNASTGYPRTGTFHDQRLMAAGTTKFPQTLWGSRVGESLDFTLGLNDDDGFSYKLSGDDNQRNMINFLVSAKKLLGLTYGGEFSLGSSNGASMTPTNPPVDSSETAYGVKNVRPVQVGKETLFVQRGGRKLRAMGYSFNDDGYNSPDLAPLAEHLTKTGIKSMAFQKEPDPVVWIALNNGKLVSVTLDRNLDVLAWNQHETIGAVESIAVLPNGDLEDVWMIVRRSVNGATVRYVERMQSQWWPEYGTTAADPNVYPPQDDPFEWGFQLDCAISQDSAGGTATWANFDHLEGESIRVLADGYDMGSFVVSGGSITLPRTAKRVLGGLFFAPEIVLLTPAFNTPEGTNQADALSVSSIQIKVYNTIGTTIDGAEILPGRINGPNQLGVAPELFTGLKSTTGSGWEQGVAENTISQNAPFPFHLIQVVRTVTANQG